MESGTLTKLRHGLDGVVKTLASRKCRPASSIVAQTSAARAFQAAFSGPSRRGTSVVSQMQGVGTLPALKTRMSASVLVLNQSEGMAFGIRA